MPRAYLGLCVWRTPFLAGAIPCSAKQFRTELCQKVLASGHCHYGDRCTFLHPESMATPGLEILRSAARPFLQHRMAVAYGGVGGDSFATAAMAAAPPPGAEVDMYSDCLPMPLCRASQSACRRAVPPSPAGSDTILDIPMKALTPQGMRLIISDPRADVYTPTETFER